MEENCDNVLAAPDVQQAVCFLEEKIHSHMDRCMPVRTVSMLPHDPPWMTPFLSDQNEVQSFLSEQRQAVCY